jgi:prophage DNA circulation protein
MAQIYKATLDGYDLQVMSITDSIPQAITRHRFIDTDGAFLVNSGLNERTVKFKAFFFGEDKTTSATYQNHFDFLTVINNTGDLHDLIHPIYGKMQGYVEASEPYTDDTQQAVVIDITFIEHGIKDSGALLSVMAIDLVLQAQQVSQLNSEIKKTTGQISASGFGAVVGKAVDFTKKLSNQFSNVNRATRNYIAAVDTAVSVFDQFMSTISEPAKTITNAVNFATDLPSRLLTSINSCLYRIIGAQNAVINSPQQIVNGIVTGVNTIHRTLQNLPLAYHFQARLRAVAAGHIAATAGILLQADEQARKTALSAELTPSFDEAGNRIGRSQIAPYMSVNDLESIAYQVRHAIQDILELDTVGLILGESGRDNPDLITMAASIQDFINMVKLQRYKIVNMSVNNIPIHLLCLKIGLPYNAADRILKINPQIKCPNFIEGNIKIYAR